MTNDMMNTPMTEPPPSTSIFQTWVNALTKPNQGTYTDIASSPRASTTNAFLWVFIATLIQFFVSFLVGGAAQSQLMKQFGGENLPTPTFGSRAVQLICGAPIAAVIAVLFFALLVAVVHLIARAFGGRATYDRLAYVMSAIVVPMNLIGALLSLLSAIPFIGLCFGVLSLILGIYAIVLEVIAVMAVEQVGAMQAAVSVLALPVAFCLCVTCVLAVGAAALGPMLGNVFSSINQSLQGVP